MSILQHCIAGISAALLLTLLPGCGEIELPTADDPQPPTTPGTETPTPPGGDGGDGSGTAGDGNGPAEDGGKPAEGGGDNTGDAGNTIQRIDGTGVSIVNGKHILIEDFCYLSAEELYGAYGAYADAAAYAATLEMADAYSEGELAEWRIPTEEEARRLRDCLESFNISYGTEPLPLINKAVNALGWQQLSNDIRYLCDGGRKSFNLHPDGKVTKSGTKTMYSLRLVHDIVPDKD